MNNYIATFYSHFGALSFCKELKSLEIDTDLSPVPRSLSTSCGICVRFSADKWEYARDAFELEAIYLDKEEEYCQLYSS